MAWTSWALLAVAILLEVSATTCLKLSEGLTKILPSVGIFIFYILSFGTLALILKESDISVIYAVWAGAGTALIAAVGILWFREPITALKIASIGLIVIGVVGLNLGSGH